MRSPFRKRRFDSAAKLLSAGAGLSGFTLYPSPFRLRAGLAGPSPMASAIATSEGYYVAGSIPSQANNPGDLELGNIGYGTIGAAGGNNITVFPSADSGWQALENQINLIASGGSSVYPQNATIAQVGNIYSGSTNGNWANNVASALGVSPTASFAANVSAPGTDSSTAGASDLLSMISDSTDNTNLYIGAGVGVGTLLLALYAFN